MDALEVKVERGFHEHEDRVCLSLSTAFGTFPVRMTPKQAREFADAVREFADSADPDVPFVKIPLAKTMLCR